MNHKSNMIAIMFIIKLEIHHKEIYQNLIHNRKLLYSCVSSHGIISTPKEFIMIHSIIPYLYFI